MTTKLEIDEAFDKLIELLKKSHGDTELASHAAKRMWSELDDTIMSMYPPLDYEFDWYDSDFDWEDSSCNVEYEGLDDS